MDLSFFLSHLVEWNPGGGWLEPEVPMRVEEANPGAEPKPAPVPKVEPALLENEAWLKLALPVLNVP